MQINIYAGEDVTIEDNLSNLECYERMSLVMMMPLKVVSR